MKLRPACKIGVVSEDSNRVDVISFLRQDVEGFITILFVEYKVSFVLI
jgi:hypothetical protein